MTPLTIRTPRLHAAAVAVALAAFSLAASAGPEPAPAPAAPPAARPVPSAHVGHVTAIDPIRVRPKGTGAGAVAGGVVGGVLGHELFGGTAATVIGAAGGAVAGNNVERNVRKEVTGYAVHVRLDDGRSRTITVPHVGDLHVGDRVRVDGGRVHRL
jgi:outer membrane lipoprotein SlyB